MQSTKCDVVIRFEEATGKLIVQAVPIGQLDTFFQRPHAAWIGQVNELRSLSHEQAESLVGFKVLRELDRYSAAGLHLRDFEAFEQEELQATLAALEERAKSGESAAQFEAFLALWNQALKNHSLELLDRAEQYLSAASAQGQPRALAMSSTWPKLKAEAVASIGKDPSSSG